MANEGRGARHVDRDGIAVTATGKVRSGVWLLLLALAIVGATLLFIAGPLVSEQPTVAARSTDNRSAAPKADAEQRAAVPARRMREGGASERPQLPPQEQRAGVERSDDGAAPADAAEEAADGAAEGPSGIELFPPPGTDPVKTGIVVPEGFELPEGYVRHHQTTDNGKQLPPILMFHPDYQPVDANGEKIALPEDRIVPPEMAPPGLAPEMLDVPDDSVPMIEGPNDRPDAD